MAMRTRLKSSMRSRCHSLIDAGAPSRKTRLVSVVPKKYFVPNGSTTDASTPVGTTGLNGGVALSAGLAHSCAQLANGSMKCWGANPSGQLGNGTTANASMPVAVSGLTGVVATVAGASHSCAALAAGSVKCWGLNASGQLGDGSTTNSPTAVSVTGLS